MPKSQQKQCNFKKWAKDLNRCSSKADICTWSINT